MSGVWKGPGCTVPMVLLVPFQFKWLKPNILQVPQAAEAWVWCPIHDCGRHKKKIQPQGMWGLDLAFDTCHHHHLSQALRPAPPWISGVHAVL